MAQSEQLKLAQQELFRASAARLDGNEGKARVCARRAAGYIVSEFFDRNGYDNPGSSSIVRLKLFNSISDVPGRAREIVDHFLIHVTPDHDLPVEADLIQEARILAELILDERI
jgi:hypothetical protein